jgi:hypothetical protein
LNITQYLTGGVILIGGQSGNKLLDTLYELKSISGSWKEVFSKLKIPRRNFASWTVPSDLLLDCTSGVCFMYLIEIVEVVSK